ncbi:MAG: hypothetical protein E7595_06105 [Ruminococcaceae bacterium]|nr:hypothetical protein [Oscillospiraceae bacterium]
MEVLFYVLIAALLAGLASFLFVWLRVSIFMFTRATDNGDIRKSRAGMLAASSSSFAVCLAIIVWVAYLIIT